MELLRVANLIIAGSVCTILAGLAMKRPNKAVYWPIDYKEHPNTTWALSLWFVWWLTLFFIYLGLDSSYTITLVLSDFGNLCALGAAIAYCKGNEFKVSVLKRLGYVFAIEVIWDFAITSLHSVSDYSQGRIVIIGPSLLISGISSLALGWAIVVRCGWTAWPFLLFAAAYSAAQLPAYFYVFVVRVEGDLKGHFNKLVWSLLFLAIGKIIYAWAFLGYFFSPAHDPETIKVKEYWPDDEREVRMHPKLAKWFGPTIGVIVVAFLTTLATAFVPGFVDWIKNVFGGIAASR
jgi:hypothetical protein